MMSTTSDSPTVHGHCFVGQGHTHESTNDFRAGVQSAEAMNTKQNLSAASAASAVMLELDSCSPYSGADSNLDGTSIGNSSSFSLPKLPSKDTAFTWEDVGLSRSQAASLVVLFQAMQALHNDSSILSLQQRDKDLQALQDQDVTTFLQQTRDTDKLDNAKKELAPGEIAMLALSVLGLTVSILLPFVGGVAMPALVAAGVSAGVSLFTTVISGINVGVKEAIREGKYPTRLNEKCESVAWEGMSIELLVEMCYDMQVRTGAIVIKEEPSNAPKNPLAITMSRDDFNKAKKDGGVALNVVMAVLPIVAGLGAGIFSAAKAAGGLIPLMQSLPEKMASVLKGVASSFKSLESSAGDFFAGGVKGMAQRAYDGIGERLGQLGNLEAVKTAEGRLRTVQKLTEISKASVTTHQARITLGLAVLQSNVSTDQKNRKEIQERIEILNGSLPITQETAKTITDTMLNLAQIAAAIVQMENASARHPASNMTATA